MSTLRITDAASAIAAAKCWLARSPDLPERIRVYHPAGCGWCDYPREVLIEAVKGFWKSPGRGREVESFEKLPRSTQQRLVKEAQGVEA